jgi:hypothetical protein
MVGCESKERTSQGREMKRDWTMRLKFADYSKSNSRYDWERGGGGMYIINQIFKETSLCQ